MLRGCPHVRGVGVWAGIRILASEEGAAHSRNKGGIILANETDAIICTYFTEIGPLPQVERFAMLPLRLNLLMLVIEYIQ